MLVLNWIIIVLSESHSNRTNRHTHEQTRACTASAYIEQIYIRCQNVIVYNSIQKHWKKHFRLFSSVCVQVALPLGLQWEKTHSYSLLLICNRVDFCYYHFIKSRHCHRTLPTSMRKVFYCMWNIICPLICRTFSLFTFNLAEENRSEHSSEHVFIIHIGNCCVHWVKFAYKRNIIQSTILISSNWEQPFGACKIIQICNYWIFIICAYNCRTPLILYT